MSYSLTSLQIAIMAVLWKRGEASVFEVHDALRSERRIAQSTVATLLSRLEDKGLVDHREDRRLYVYRPLVSEDQARRSIVKEFTELSNPLFSGDLAGLVSHLLSARDVNPSEIARIRDIVDRMVREVKSGEGRS